MSAPQDEPRRPPGAFLAQRVRGSLTMMLIATFLLAAGWTVSREKPKPVVRPAVEAHAISALKALPGSPENVLSARLSGIDYDQARQLNAAIPLPRTAGPAAPPYQFVGSVADRNRATDCLAIAAIAEAGKGDDGQRAVIQVVLNRVRHPAFAKSICGVVFEGSHRASGCQFTFTCDGALGRRYSAESWTRARDRASQALDGRVYGPVGLATHYHTDWVHPYWSDSLAKLARVDTHLFFRWRGYWGSIAALSDAHRGGEPAIPQLAYLPAHAGAAGGQLLAGQPTSATALRDIVVRNGDGGAFVLLTAAPSTTSAREMGRRICMDRPLCKVFGWFDRAAIPGGYPVSSSARAQLGFSYFRDAQNAEIVLYDCARFASVAADGCIPRTIGMRAALRAKPAPSPIAMTSLPATLGNSGL